MIFWIVAWVTLGLAIILIGIERLKRKDIVEYIELRLLAAQINPVVLVILYLLVACFAPVLSVIGIGIWAIKKIAS